MYGKSTSSQTKNLSLTVYNNTALINETREIPKYKSDPNPYITIEYFDISKYIDETSVIITGIDDFIMIFNYLCCNNKNPNPSPCDTCENLIPNSILIKGNNIDSKEIKAYYLTDNIRWSSSYTIILYEKTLEIHSWFNLINKSGIDYNNATLKVIAGDVNLAYKNLYISNTPIQSTKLESSTPITDIEIADYYIYTVPGKYNFLNNTIKRIKNFYKNGIIYSKLYDFGYESINANIIIKFQNTAENNLGFPFPSGNINSYTRFDGNLEFVGGSTIKDIAKDREVSYIMGKAFDVTSQRKIITYQKYKDYILKEVQYIITNTKDESIPIKICEPIFAPWEMNFATDRYQTDKNGNPCFQSIIEPNSKKEILFSYKYDVTSS
ncbi:MULTISPECIES: DUF4139 domain-containing protein [Clostridium]|uniref:DUF4139 domain-containing protein n=1 Tax=Clostridium TaxID=1485 RepID=UPI00214A461E|nr:MULTISPECIES: hypothetical protein [Clostridium]MCR1950928.1 hypothetical protein [Clostridium sp. DSM 100503]MDI9216465.1 hypothetical protein [Clostridium tertium]